MIERDMNTNTNVGLTQKVREIMMAKKLPDGTINSYNFYDDEDDSDDDTKVKD